MALTSLEVRNAKPGRHADGNGLYLFVRPTGARSWLLRTQAAGKRRDLGLGAFPAVSLAMARAKAADLRSRVKGGEHTLKAGPLQPIIPSFEEAGRACHEALKAGWRNKHHQFSWLASLENHVFPKLGAVPADEVSPALVRDAPAPIWLTIPETARRILQRITKVLDYSHISGWCEHEASLRTVPKGLPRQTIDERHYEAMDYSLVPDLLCALQAAPATAGRDALMFTIFNAVRSGETRLARWTEIDWKDRTWTIPATRMKMRKQHQVPLTCSTLAILERRRLIKSQRVWTCCSQPHTFSYDFNLKVIRSDIAFYRGELPSAATAAVRPSLKPFTLVDVELSSKRARRRASGLVRQTVGLGMPSAAKDGKCESK